QPLELDAALDGEVAFDDHDACPRAVAVGLDRDPVRIVEVGDLGLRLGAEGRVAVDLRVADGDHAGAREEVGGELVQLRGGRGRGRGEDARHGGRASDVAEPDHTVPLVRAQAVDGLLRVGSVAGGAAGDGGVRAGEPARAGVVVAV